MLNDNIELLSSPNGKYLYYICTCLLYYVLLNVNCVSSVLMGINRAFKTSVGLVQEWITITTRSQSFITNCSQIPINEKNVMIDRNTNWLWALLPMPFISIYMIH